MMKRIGSMSAAGVLAALLLVACGGTESPGGGAVEANNTPNNDVNNDAPNNDAPNNDAPNNDAPNNDVNNAPNNDPNNDVNNAPNNDPNNDPGPPTFYRDVKPLLEANCNGCHAEGGVGPFQMESYAQVQIVGQAIKTAVVSRSMPPWLPEDGCRDIKGSRRLTDAQIDTIARWVDEGMAEGDPADDPNVARADLTLRDPDLILRAASPYTANTEQPDDYRCLVIDHEFTQDTFISAYQVVPDKRALVHHVLFYLVPPAEVERLGRLEAEDAEPGYRCFGGPRAGDLLGTVAGWVPGSVPLSYPENSAYVIPAGHKIVMQVHYNTLTVSPEPDRTELHVKLLDQPPANIIKILPVPVFELDIPADEPDATHSTLFPNIFGKTLTIVGTAPHMHMLGKKMQASIGHANGSRDCVVDIQDWDFNWQQFYEFQEDAYITMAPGDTVSLRCVHDNSAANQPVVNGEQLQPRDVEWGDGSLDEMCLLYLTTMEPWDGLSTCANFGACNQSCEPDDGACTLDCISQGGGDCRQCGLLGLGECAARRCGNISERMLPCILGCINAPDLGTCFADRCPDRLDEFWGCLGPAYYDGQCNANINSCNLAP